MSLLVNFVFFVILGPLLGYAVYFVIDGMPKSAVILLVFPVPFLGLFMAYVMSWPIAFFAAGLNFALQLTQWCRPARWALVAIPAAILMLYFSAGPLIWPHSLAALSHALAHPGTGFLSWRYLILSLTTLLVSIICSFFADRVVEKLNDNEIVTVG